MREFLSFVKGVLLMVQQENSIPAFDKIFKNSLDPNIKSAFDLFTKWNAGYADRVIWSSITKPAALPLTVLHVASPRVVDAKDHKTEQITPPSVSLLSCNRRTLH